MMRAIQIALLLLCIQVGLGLVAGSDIFDGVYYESEITDYSVGDNPLQSESEQVQASISGLQSIWNILSWDWITRLFEPWYSNNVGVKALIDHVLLFLRSLTALLVVVALVEFVRNRSNILG
jgi:hypothetical protein